MWRSVLVTAGWVVMTAALARAHEGHDHDDERRSHGDAAATAALESRVQIAEKDGYRTIESNGIPDHEPGAFPNRGNPNRISEQKHRYRVTLSPKAAPEPTPIRGPFGVALNGVPFDPGTAEFWSPGSPRSHTRSAWNYDALSGKINLGVDASNAHVQPTGAYHYHGLPSGLIARRDGEKKMTLIGYAADGFPIYNQYSYADDKDASRGYKIVRSSWRLKEGDRPGGDDGPGGRYDGTYTADWQFVDGAGDLDQCNGRVGPTPEHPQGIYHYHVTEAYPFIPRYFRGTPDPSFMRGPGGPGAPGGPRGGPPGRRPPPPGGPGGSGERPPGPPPDVER